MFRSSRFLLEKFDVCIVGGGPGGYVAAIKAAQLGLRTACVEKRGALGGTCLNFHEAKHDFAKKGITGAEAIQPDIPVMMKQKDKVIRTLTRGVAGLFKANGVTPYDGAASFVDANTIKVAGGKSDGETIETDNVIIAVGSEVAGLPGFPKELIDEKNIVSSTGGLEFKSVPKTLTVVGGGVIGLELGSVWARLGAKVHVVEFLDKIMGPADAEVSAQFQKMLEKQGLTFSMGSKVVAVEDTGAGVKLAWEDMKSGEKTEQVAEKVLISTGRSPNTANVGLENLGIELDKFGFIPTDGNLHCTGAGEGVYAIGDCIRGPMLAHKAEEDGVYAAEQIADKVKNGVAKKSHEVSYHGVPSVVYTHPEVAWVGKSEEELKAEGVEYSKATFPMAANSRARANDDVNGFVKLLTSPEDDILGCHIVAPGAGDVIMPAVFAVQNGYKCKELAHTCFAHPSISEALKEACMKASFGNFIHMP